MPAQNDPAGASTLAAFGAALDEARSALTEQPNRPLDAVGWLSAHLATADRVLHRSLGRGQRRVLRPAAHTLQEEVRWLEQVHSGDALVAGRDAEQQRQHAVQAIDTYAEVERLVLTSLVAQLDDDRRQDLVAAYRRALEVAPTRPHPHLPSRGLAGAVAFRIESWWDRAMNTMDSRHVPTPRRQREVAAAGKWTGYLLGGLPAVETASVKQPSRQ
jgi:hypothetical protein